jgi:DNA-binding response OmpR family regulator/HD-like signal output (HDOD) protein
VAWRILLAEDDKPTRELMYAALGEEGYDVTAVADGSAAVKAFDEARFDLILLDVMMPGLSGLEVLGRVRGGAKHADIPVIMVSGLNDPAEIERVLELGADDYVTKSPELGALLARIEGRLRRHPTVEPKLGTVADESSAHAKPKPRTGASAVAPSAKRAVQQGHSAETIAARLGGIIQSRMAKGNLPLPSPPETANRCLALLDKPEVITKEFVKVLKRDPLLSARLMFSANTARYAGGQRATTLEQAVTRLGHNGLKEVLVSASMRSLYASTDPRIATTVRSMFLHALAVAEFGRDVSTAAGSDNDEVIYLAGLLHDVGKVVIAGYLLEIERTIVGVRRAQWLDATAWLAIVREGHRPIGVALAESWAFPPAVVAAVRDCTEFDVGNRTAPGNYVCFANAVAKSIGLYESETDDLENSATIMLGKNVLGVSDEMFVTLTQDLHARITALAPS